jgi:hypothetical protein
MQLCTYFAKDVHGEHCPEIFQLGKQFMGIFVNGRKTVHGLWYMTNSTNGLELRFYRQPSPSEAAVDSQSVETATMISQEVGYDAGKKIHGREGHLTVDLLGLVLRVLVTSASIPERQGAKKVLKQVHDMGSDRVNRLHTIWMDGGY